MKRRLPVISQKKVPARSTAKNIDSLLGTLPLFPGEDREAYKVLRQRVRKLVKPTDIIEAFWTRDVVDLMWEINRLRRLKAKLMKISAHKGLREILQPILGEDEADDLVEGKMTGRPAAKKKVKKLLALAKIDREAVTAQTLVVEIGSIERIEGLISGAESRLSAVLREIERHRASVSIRLRKAVTAIEDGQYEEVSEPGNE